jgi:ATP-dependent DNA helicase RecG
VVEVPRATREQRPVFLNGNPLNAFRRLNEADCRIDESLVKRMLAEQAEPSRDGRVLRDFGMSDLSGDTIAAYRVTFATQRVDHPFLQGNEIEFLQRIGAWGRDRELGGEGPTAAGLLMFGHARAIQEEFPNYLLDYQERPEAKTEARWIDRLTLDGTWSGNLYDFFWKVYRKLIDGLKVPFAVRGGVREEDSAVHQALREALVNTLVHADYSASASILVVKRPDLFGFRNPGRMRVPAAIARHGGHADCRNRLLHQMFRYVGLGEQAGSGIPRIFESWKGQNWAPPLLLERENPSEQTLLRLRTVDLVPPAVRAQVREMARRAGATLDANAELVLAAAIGEDLVDHARVREVCGLPAPEATRLLQNLVRAGLLVTDNPGRGAVYVLPGSGLPRPVDVFGDELDARADTVTLEPRSSEHLKAGSEHLRAGSEHSRAGSEQFALDMGSVRRDLHGRRLPDALDAPLVDALDQLTPDYRDRLTALAEPAKRRKRLSSPEMRKVIQAICQNQYVALPVLAELLDRSSDALRQQHLKPMQQAALLVLAFPTSPTHPKQAYRSGEATP